jgi:hypothetical protein
MDALEAFSKLVGLWPKSFQPRETWRPLVLEELESWPAAERADVINSMTSGMSGARSVDLKALKAARAKASKPKANLGHGTEDSFLADLGLLEIYKTQHIGDRIMISRLIRSMMLTPGWEARLAEQAGDAREFRDWERIENLIHVADKAMTPTKNGLGRKVCYPADKDGWSAPKEQIQIILPRPKRKTDRSEDREGLARISAIAAKFGGFQAGACAQIFESAEYQKYLEDYTARTGQQPA